MALGFLMVWGLLCVGAAGVGAAELGSVEGHVQREGKGLADYRIMLIRFGPGQEVHRVPGQTDAEGRFVFDQLETGAAFTYVVGVRVEEQLYQSDAVTLEEGQRRTGVVVEIGTPPAPAAKAPDALPVVRLESRLIVVAWRTDHFELREIVSVHNTGSTPYRGAVRGGYTAFSLHFPLPQGYVNLRNVQGLDPQQLHTLPAGLFYTGPLAPGQQRVGFTYDVPVRTKVTTVLLEHSLATRVFEILVEDQHLAAASDLQFGGRVAFEPHSFLHFRGADLEARSRSWLQLTRVAASPGVLQVGTYGLMMGIALLGVAIPLYGVWRSRTTRQPTPSVTPVQLQEMHAARRRLLQTIARLDNQHEASEIEEDAYQQRRQGYKKQLLELAADLHHAQQNKDNGV